MHLDSISLWEQGKRAFFLNAQSIKIPILHPTLKKARMIAGNGTGLASGIWQRTLEFQRSMVDLGRL
jgi:hypothetical protein